MDATTLAKKMIAEHASTADIVDATGLEPKEVSQLFMEVNTPKESLTPEAKLGLMASELLSLSNRAAFPPATQRKLAKAAQYVNDGIDAYKADAGKAQKRAEIARLEAKVKAMKAELRGQATTGGTVSTGPNPKLVREWASQSGVQVPARGRIPKDVVDAFLVATAS